MKPLTKSSVRLIGVMVSTVFFMVLGCWFQVGFDSHAQTPETPLAPPKDKSPDLYKFMGAASCGGPGCHGQLDPKKRKFPIKQDEYFRWLWNAETPPDSRNPDSIIDFGHSKAFENLKTADSQRMAKNLGIKNAESEPRCLACHAVPVEDNRKGANYELQEGVTCEGCHGPAEQWLGPHTRKDWDKKKGAAFGMLDTKNLVKRAERCLVCHLGTDKAIVDHELIGAGHPRLNFELDAFSALMPVHWLPPKEKAERDWLGAKTWVVGQAVTLRHQLELLSASRKSRAVLGPDLIYFDCYACHHDVVDRVRGVSEGEKKLQRWRVKDYTGRKPGRLIWNAANYTVFRHAVRDIAPDKAGALDQVVSNFHDALTGKSSMTEFEQALSKLQRLSEELVLTVEQHKLTQKEVWSIMRRISGDASNIANAGFQSAEQAVLAISTLQSSYEEAMGPLPNGKAIAASIDQLNTDIVLGQKFNLVQFGQHLTALRKLLEPDAPSSSSTGAVTSKPTS
jgi:predicted XRE-type DNA-binding protein